MGCKAQYECENHEYCDTHVGVCEDCVIVCNPERGTEDSDCMNHCKKFMGLDSAEILSRMTESPHHISGGNNSDANVTLIVAGILLTLAMIIVGVLVIYHIGLPIWRRRKHAELSDKQYQSYNIGGNTKEDYPRDNITTQGSTFSSLCHSSLLDQQRNKMTSELQMNVMNETERLLEPSYDRAHRNELNSRNSETKSIEKNNENNMHSDMTSTQRECSEPGSMEAYHTSMKYMNDGVVNDTVHAVPDNTDRRSPKTINNKDDHQDTSRTNENTSPKRLGSPSTSEESPMQNTNGYKHSLDIQFPPTTQATSNETESHMQNVPNNSLYHRSRNGELTETSPNCVNIEDHEHNICSPLIDCAVAEQPSLVQQGNSNKSLAGTRNHDPVTGDISFSIDFRSDGPLLSNDEHNHIDTNSERTPLSASRFSREDSNHWHTVMRMYDAVDGQMHRLSFVAGCMIGSDSLHVYVRPRSDMDIEACHNRIVNIIPTGTDLLLVVEPESPDSINSLATNQSMMVGSYNTHISCAEHVQNVLGCGDKICNS